MGIGTCTGGTSKTLLNQAGGNPFSNIYGF